MGTTQIVGEPSTSTSSATAFRIVAEVQLLAVFTQAAFAGLFMGGVHAFKTAHGIGGMVVLALAISQMVVAAVMRRPTRAVVVSAVMVAAVLGQVISGGSHVFAVHVPLAMLLFGGALRCTVLARQQAVGAQGRRV